MTTKKRSYRVIFHSQGKIYEIYARGVSQSAMYGFVEVEGLVFGERSSVVVDPSEEQLKSEFGHVKRTYLPAHSVIRIDEVDKEGQGKVIEGKPGAANVMPFPGYPQPDKNKP